MFVFHLQTNLCSSLHFVLHSARSLTGTVLILLASSCRARWECGTCSEESQEMSRRFRDHSTQLKQKNGHFLTHSGREWQSLCSKFDP